MLGVLRHHPVRWRRCAATRLRSLADRRRRRRPGERRHQEQRERKDDECGDRAAGGRRGPHASPSVPHGWGKGQPPGGVGPPARPGDRWRRHPPAGEIAPGTTGLFPEGKRLNSPSPNPGSRPDPGAERSPRIAAEVALQGHRRSDPMTDGREKIWISEVPSASGDTGKVADTTGRGEVAPPSGGR